MAAFQRDEAVRRMNAFHDELERAMPDAERFQTVFREAPEGVGAHEIDTKGVIQRVNPQELRLLGYEEAQMVGHSVSEFAVMQEASQRGIGQRLEGLRDTKPFLRAFRRADGSAITLLLMVRIIRSPDGETTGIRTVMTEAPL